MKITYPIITEWSKEDLVYYITIPTRNGYIEDITYAHHYKDINKYAKEVLELYLWDKEDIKPVKLNEIQLNKNQYTSLININKNEFIFSLKMLISRIRVLVHRDITK